MGNVEKEKPDSVGLKRELGLFSAASLIVAVMIGSGIFISPTGALAKSGSVGLSLVIWAVSGLLSLLCALSFAELSTVVPRSGAEYAYIMEAFSPLHRYLGQLPAFLCSWINIMVIRPAQVAVVIMTFAAYIVEPFTPYLAGISAVQLTIVKRLIALMAIALITYINITSVKLYVKVQNVFTVCKIAACLLVIGGGLYWLGIGHTELLQDPFKGTTSSPGNIALALYSGLWGYEGWNVAALVTEEVKRPEVNILRSILVAVPIVTILYVGMNLMYMSVLSESEMVASSAVAVTWAEKVLPPWLSFAIPLGVALSCFGCCLSLQFGVARMCHVAGGEGHMPRFFSFIHMNKNTPVAAVVFQALLTFAYIVAGDIYVLIELCSFLLWTFYGLAMVALLILRKSKPDADRPYRVATFVPWFVLFMAAFLAIMPIISDPSPKYFFAVLLMLIGVVLHHFYVYKNNTSGLYRQVMHVAQALCLIVETDKAQTD